MIPLLFNRYKAFLFDLNGTMINDMHYHVDAWYSILNKLGAGLTHPEVKAQCYGKTVELIERIFPGRYTMEEKEALCMDKEKKYQEDFRPQLKLVNGLPEMLEAAHMNKIKMAIGSAAIPFNIDYVLDGLDIRHYFDVVVSADDVKKSKPHPETWLLCAEKLGVDPPDCLVFEDVPMGVASASNAGMDAIVITTMHEPSEFIEYKNIIGYGPDFAGLMLNNTSAEEVNNNLRILD